MKSEGRAGRVEFDFALHEAHDINHLSLLAGNNSIPREQRLNMFSLINSLQEERNRAPGAGGAGLELVARQGAAGGPEAALMKK